MSSARTLGRMLGKAAAAKELDIIEVKCRQPDNSLSNLLAYIGAIGNIGHSFGIDVDPGNSEYRHKFGWDGDGSDHIESVKVNGKQVKWNKGKEKAT